jgi:hypothetical protein
MAFSLRLPKLSGGPVEIPKIFAETPKVLEILKNIVEILKFFEKRQMLTLSGDFRDFAVFGPVLNLTANIWVRSLQRLSGDSELNNFSK